MIFRILVSFYFCSFLSLFNCIGQNLILNGSFEQFSGCPTDQGQFELCKNWSVPNYSTPDWYNNCSNTTKIFAIPYNLAGYQFPRTGNAYAGFYLLDARNFRNREYIQGELQYPLEKGKIYKMVFYISYGDRSTFPSDRLGYKFSEEKIQGPKSGKIGKLQKKSDGRVKFSKPIMDDDKNWNAVEFEYTAKGGEKFFVLGIFRNDLNKRELKELKRNHLLYPKDKASLSYYYFDDLFMELKKEKRSNTLGTE